MSRGAKIAVVAGASALVVMFVLSLLERASEPDTSIALAEEAEDLARLKQIAMYVALRTEVAMTKGGQLDVYRVVRDAEPDDKALADLCYSARARSGPTLEEIRGGDYRRFPYARIAAKFDRRDGRRTAILWDGSPQTNGRRLVALDDGTVETIEEAAFAAFLERHAR